MFFIKAKDMENSIKLHEKRIAELEDHKNLCELKHTESAEHRKRSDDSINKLTDSIFVFTKSINEMNITITEALPTLTRAKNGFTTVDTLKNAALWVAAVAGGLAALAALNNFLIH